jgi:DNA-binding transcriptional LysR family regulator
MVSLLHLYAHASFYVTLDPVMTALRTTHSKSDHELPMKRIASLWSWLPAFRAVAETEHLPRAASLLGTSPPALSRTLKLLEKSIGAVLFDKAGTRLVLNARGRRLLVHVREAMRIVDEGLGDRAERLVRVAVPDGLAAAVLGDAR